MITLRLYFLWIGLIQLSLLQIGICIQSSDDWNTVVDTTSYQNLPSCAKDCVLNVNTLTNCKDLSCVCSGMDPRGTNFLASYNNVSSCVQQGCNDGADLNQAINSFKDICAVAVDIAPSSGTTSTPTPTIITSLGSVTVS